MNDDLVFLDSVLLQQDMRIRLPKSLMDMNFRVTSSERAERENNNFMLLYSCAILCGIETNPPSGHLGL